MERAALSLNSMRDLVLPLGQAVANEAASEAGFEILMDTELNPQKGLYGRRTVFKFKVDGVSQTVDQTVMTNDRHSKLYYLVVRCTTQCFDARHDELTKVVKSLTIKG